MEAVFSGVIRGLDPRLSEMAGSSPAMTVRKAIQPDS
jgi:hypothetical protein